MAPNTTDRIAVCARAFLEVNKARVCPRFVQLQVGASARIHKGSCVAEGGVFCFDTIETGNKMNTHFFRNGTALLAGLFLTASLIAQPAFAAPKKPGLYGPTTVAVGQEVIYTSVFKGAVKKNGCFTSLIDFSDEANQGVSITFGLCMKSSKKVTFRNEVDSEKHVFTTPGTYTVSAQALGIPNSGGGAAEAKYALVKGGPKNYSLTVTVTP